QEPVGGRVDDRMDRIEPQRVDPELVHPLQRRGDEVFAYVIGVGTVEVQGIAPRGAISIGEVRPEARQVIAVRAEMVVDDVEADTKALVVARIDEALECCRSPVRVLHGERVHPVVAPVTRSGELRERHQLDDADPEVTQCGQPACSRVERALRREGADVQLVEDVLVEGQAGPVVPGPLERWRAPGGAAVNAVRLVARCRVRQHVATVESVAVTLAGPDAGDAHCEIGVVVAPHRDRFAPRVVEHQLDRLYSGCPDAERGAVALQARAERQRRAWRHAPSGLRFRIRVARGGSVSVIDRSWPCEGSDAASTPPRLPTPLPPYTVASLFRISCQWRMAGTPSRWSWRTSGVKLPPTISVSSGSGPIRM